MTLYGVIFSALARKVKALVAEYRKLVAEATKIEQETIAGAKRDIAVIFSKAKAEETEILSFVETKTASLKNDLINKIASI
jgi:hypothetical protein